MLTRNSEIVMMMEMFRKASEFEFMPVKIPVIKQGDVII